MYFFSKIVHRKKCFVHITTHHCNMRFWIIFDSLFYKNFSNFMLDLKRSLSIFLHLTQIKTKPLVEMDGFEPTASCLRSTRSPSWATPPLFYLTLLLVEVNGIEPMTSCLQSTRSPSWAIPPLLSIRLFLKWSSGGPGRTWTSDPTLIKRVL